MAEDKGKDDVKGNETEEADVEKPDEFYLGSWKDKAAAEEGLANMQSKLDSQGNEVGNLRKQVDFTQQVIEDMKAQPPPAPKASEPKGDGKADIKKAMRELDPVDETINLKC